MGVSVPCVQTPHVPFALPLLQGMSCHVSLSTLWLERCGDIHVGRHSTLGSNACSITCTGWTSHSNLGFPLTLIPKKLQAQNITPSSMCRSSLSGAYLAKPPNLAAYMCMSPTAATLTWPTVISQSPMPRSTDPQSLPLVFTLIMVCSWKAPKTVEPPTPSPYTRLENLKAQGPRPMPLLPRSVSSAAFTGRDMVCFLPFTFPGCISCTTGQAGWEGVAGE